jgi:UDP-N-acetylglucosamine transferase subunit ALG13
MLYRHNASVVVGHAGAGTILTTLAHGTPLVVMPRRAAHGEHLDDHQLELAGQLDGRDGVFVAEGPDELESALERGLAESGTGTQTSGDLVEHFAGTLEEMVEH